MTEFEPLRSQPTANLGPRTAQGHHQDVPDGHQEARHAIETTSPGRGNPPGPPGAVAAAAELPVDPARVRRMPINYSL